MDSAGRVVVVGDSEVSEETEQEAVVVRYTAAGVPDSTFGSGDGIVQLHFGTEPWDDAAAVAIDGSGRIVVAGRSQSDPACTSYCEAAVVRLTSSGQLDPTFSEDGTFTTGIKYSRASAVTIDGSGRIVVGGGEEVLRFTDSGSLDASFSGDGVATVISGAGLGVAIDSAGRIVTADYFNDRVAVARLLSTGEPDPSFDENGVVVTNVVSGSSDYPNALAVDGSDRILVAGSTLLSGASEGRLFVLRYTLSGTLDPTFDGDGLVMGDEHSWANGIAVDDSDRPLVVGHWPSLGVLGDILIRYRSDGSFDPSFAAGAGFAAVPFLGTDVTTDPAQRIVVGGSAFVSDQDFAAARYIGGGSVPPEEESSPPPAPSPSSPAPAGSLGTSAQPTRPTTRLGKATINGARGMATFRFSGQGNSTVRFQCRLDRGIFKPCRSPKAYRKLKPGQHVFRVRARDALGQADKTPAIKRFRIPKGASGR